MTKEEKMINDKLVQSDFELQDAMNRDDIYFGNRKSLDNNSLMESEELDQTRNKLSKWFPVWSKEVNDQINDLNSNKIHEFY